MAKRSLGNRFLETSIVTSLIQRSKLGLGGITILIPKIRVDTLKMIMKIAPLTWLSLAAL